MRFEETAFTVVDVETTGLFAYSGDKICELAALRVELDGSTSSYETLVDPEKSISPGAFAVNGITPQMLSGQPKIDEVLPDFMGFIKNSVLVAYNAAFDLGFLECALGSGREALRGSKVVDALRLARRLFPGLQRYSLTSVANHFHIYPDAEHRAMADVLTTWQVFELELEALRMQGVDTVDAIAHPILLNREVGGFPEARTVTTLIRTSIVSRSPICIKYRSAWDEKISQRTITPISMHDGYESPYVVAYCHLRRARRTFHLSGILEAVPDAGKSWETADEA